MKTIKCLLIVIFFLPSLSFAFLCPNNFNQYVIGDTEDQVTQQCGKPDLQEKKIVEPDVPQEWTYFISQTVAMGGATPQVQGTLKTSFSFDQSGKAINISVNGIGVGGTTICGNSVQLGASQDEVKTACGKPAFINKQQGAQTDTTPKPTQVIFTYNTNPPVQMIFQDGKLIEKK
jgi:hypothetical protein